MMFEVRVVAVPERADRASALAADLGATVVMDTAHEGAFPTHLRALDSARAGSHVLVLEDDAIPCGHLIEHVAELVAERPNDMIGLYVGRARPERIQLLLASLAGSGRWLDDPVVRERLRWAVAYVVPTADIDALRDRAVRIGQHPYINTDVRLGAWHAIQGRLSYPRISHVDHDDTLRSTAGRERLGRTAWWPCPEPAAGREAGGR